MNALAHYLENKIKEYTEIKNKVVIRLSHVTENNLVVYKTHGSTQFASRIAKSSQRTYIHKKDTKSLQPLANKAYNQKLLKHIETGLHGLLKAQKALAEAGMLDDVSPAEQLWDTWPPELKPLTECKCQSFDSRAAQWSKKYFSHLEPPEDKSHHARSGEFMRSKSEVLIADALLANRIPYHYEQRLTLQDQNIYPDFTILNPRTGKIVYWEHLGMLDDPDYANHAITKLLFYMENGHWLGGDLLITYESHDHPFHNDQIYDIILNFLSPNASPSAGAMP